MHYRYLDRCWERMVCFVRFHATFIALDNHFNFLFLQNKIKAQSLTKTILDQRNWQPIMHFFSIFLLYFVQSSIVTSYPLSQFYLFGSAAGDNNFPAYDDGSTSRIPVSVPFQFFGSAYSSIYVSICSCTYAQWFYYV